MPIQYINIGVNPNDGTGDDLRSAFLKVNDNFQLLASIGGETNTGANVGGGSGQVFSGKTNEVLNFRTIAGDSNSGITVNQVGNVITIASTFSAPASITTIVDDNNTPYTALNPNETIKILGAGAISTQLNNNEITITGSFSVYDDFTPQLRASLQLNGQNILGTGNISNVGSITTDALTVGRGPGLGTTTLTGTLSVAGTSTLGVVNVDTLGASTSVTSPSIVATGTGFSGNLTGNVTGTLYGNVSLKGVGGDPDLVVVDVDTQTITGAHYGTFNGELDGTLGASGLDLNSYNIYGQGTITVDGSFGSTDKPLTVNGYFYSAPLAPDLTPTISYGASSALFNMSQQTFGVSEAIKVRAVGTNSSQSMPLGAGIAFESTNIIDPTGPGYDPDNLPTDPEFRLHGYVGVLQYKEFGLNSDASLLDDSYSTFVARVRRKQTISDTDYLKDIIVARGDGRVSISSIDIDRTVIKPGKGERNSNTTVNPLPFDMILTVDDQPVGEPERYINFYGQYDPTLIDYDPLIPGEQAEGRAIGGYSFPRTVGAPGEVLSVPAPGSNILQWVNPITGTPASNNYFIGLADAPASYISTDAGKLLRVNSTYTGLEFTNTVTADVTGTLTGNASTATALQNPRLIAGIPFNGTSNVYIDTTKIDEAFISQPNAIVVGSGGIPVTSAIVRIISMDNLGPFVDDMKLHGTLISGDVLVTNYFLGGAPGSQYVQLEVSFTSQVVEDETGIAVTLDVDNKWFTTARARESISVAANKALTYNANSGTFNLNESTANAANTLVKRDGDGDTTLGKLKVAQLEKLGAETEIQILSPVWLNADLESTNNITLSGTLSTGFIDLTGTGTQTIRSTGQITLNPGTVVDVSGKKITNLSIVAPTNNSDAATKKYVDDMTSAVETASYQELMVEGNTGGTSTLVKADILSIKGATNGNILTQTTTTGVEVNLKSSITGVTISGDLPVTGGVTADSVRGGNVKVLNNSVTQVVTGSDLNLIPGTLGGAVVVSGGDLKIVDARLSMTGFDVMEFAANMLEQSVSLNSQTTFIRTLNWVDDSAGLAFAELPNGQNGQTKIIIMESRGTYGNALDTRPRYLVLRGRINGQERQINISASDPNGSATFIFLNNYWWRIANVA